MDLSPLFFPITIKRFVIKPIGFDVTSQVTSYSGKNCLTVYSILPTWFGRWIFGLILYYVTHLLQHSLPLIEPTRCNCSRLIMSNLISLCYIKKRTFDSRFSLACLLRIAPFTTLQLWNIIVLFCWTMVYNCVIKRYKILQCVTVDPRYCIWLRI